MEAYSMDLRQRVVGACDAGIGTRDQIAAMFQVSTAWVRRLLQRRRETGSIAPKPHGGGPVAVFDAAKLEQLQRLVKQDQDATLVQLRDRMGLAVSLSVIHRALVKLGLSYKRRRCVPRSKTVPM